MRTKNIFYVIGFILVLAICLLFSSCNKVDNSELMTYRVMFINQRTDTVGVQLIGGSTMFDLLPGDSINCPEANGKPTLIMTYKYYPVKSGHYIGIETATEHNVIERNILK